jgi:hypothetical protein
LRSQIWYINFDAPIVRQANSFDTDAYKARADRGVLALNGGRGVEHLDAMLRSGRTTERKVLDGLAAPEQLTNIFGGRRVMVAMGRVSARTDPI